MNPFLAPLPSPPTYSPCPTPPRFTTILFQLTTQLTTLHLFSSAGELVLTNSSAVVCPPVIKYRPPPTTADNNRKSKEPMLHHQQQLQPPQQQQPYQQGVVYSQNPVSLEIMTHSGVSPFTLIKRKLTGPCEYFFSHVLDTIR